MNREKVRLAALKAVTFAKKHDKNEVIIICATDEQRRITDLDVKNFVEVNTDSLWANFKNWIRKRILHHKISFKAYSVTFRNKSRLLVTTSKPRKLKGKHIDIIYMDEFGNAE